MTHKFKKYNLTKKQHNSSTCNITIGQDLWFVDGAAETARHLRTINRTNPKVPRLQTRHFTQPGGVCVRLLIVKHRVAQARVGRGIVTPSRAVDSAVLSECCLVRCGDYLIVSMGRKY